MPLAVAGWNYELVAPLAVATVVFATYTRRTTPPLSVARQLKRSLAFWGLGLLFVVAVALLTTRLGAQAGTPSAEGHQFVWSLTTVHKAVGLLLGALLVSYIPFAIVAVVSHGKRWRSGAVYSAVLAVLLFPLFAATPFLVAAGAVMSCVLVQVPQCL